MLENNLIPKQHAKQDGHISKPDDHGKVHNPFDLLNWPPRNVTSFFELHRNRLLRHSGFEVIPPRPKRAGDGDCDKYGDGHSNIGAHFAQNIFHADIPNTISPMNKARMETV